MKELFSSGGGTQSACIAALIVHGKLPKPDGAAIVDTEREHPAVWVYHDQVIVPAFKRIGLEIHRIPKSEYAVVDLWAKNGSGSLMPVFTEGGGKGKNFCSQEWKVRVLNRFWRSKGLPTDQQRRWIGFSLDEASRFYRMSEGDDYKAGRIRFPLIHDVPLHRHQAVKIVRDMGWPQPPRSACWMCPNHTENEWRNLKLEQPEAFQKAVELEREVRRKEPGSYFHKSCVPLDEVDFGNEVDLFRACDSGMCFV